MDCAAQMKRNATEFLCDLIRYKESKVKDKAALKAKWRGHVWPSDELRDWAVWNWKDAGL